MQNNINNLDEFQIGGGFVWTQSHISSSSSTTTEWRNAFSICISHKSELGINSVVARRDIICGWTTANIMCAGGGEREPVLMENWTQHITETQNSPKHRHEICCLVSSPSATSDCVSVQPLKHGRSISAFKTKWRNPFTYEMRCVYRDGARKILGRKHPALEEAAQ